MAAVASSRWMLHTDAQIELGRTFHQEGTVNEKVCESDFVPLWDGTIMRRSLAERKLLEGT